MDFSFDSIAIVPELQARAIFHSDSSQVFKDDTDIPERVLDKNTSYIPWGGDDEMPYNVLKKIEDDETLSTCQLFNAEICYGAGLQYNTEACTAAVKEEVEDFCLDNNLASYFLGVCQDFKHFGWCITVILLNEQRTKVVTVLRKEVAYCRFTKADKDGVIKEVLYANWRKPVQADEVEHIPLLNPASPWNDLRTRIAGGKGGCKFAILTKVPTPDSTYYPIPHYASIFKSKWYDIKQLIATAKKAKLENSAPIKYHIEVANKYWDGIFKAEGHYRSNQDAGSRKRGEAAHHRVSYRCAERRKGVVLYLLYFSRRQGTARCRYKSYRQQQGGRRLGKRPSGSRQYGVLYLARPFQPRWICTGQVPIEQLRF